MQALDFSSVTSYNQSLANGFIPKATFAYDPDASTLTVTDDSDIPTGDTFGKMNIVVYDLFGNAALGNIDAASGNDVIDISGLDVSRGIAVTVDAATGKHLAKSGSVWITVNALEGNVVFPTV